MISVLLLIPMSFVQSPWQLGVLRFIAGLGSGVEWRGSSGKCPAFRHDGIGGSKCGIGAGRSPRFSRCCARALSVIGTA